MYTKILFLVLLCGLCAGTPIEYESKSYDDNAHYEFEYSVHDDHTGDIKDQHETRKGDVVEGEYSLVEPDGQKRIVKYSSNKHDGFQAHVERGETKHPVPVAHHVAPIEVAHHFAPVAIAHHVAPVVTHHVSYAQPIAHIAHVAPVAHYAPVAHFTPVAHFAPVAHVVPVVKKHVATSTSHIQQTHSSGKGGEY